MTTSKRIHDQKIISSSRSRIIFNLSALLFTLIIGTLVLILFPTSAGYQPVSEPVQKNTEAPALIDNSTVEIPVLMYHYIRTVADPNDTLGKNLSVTPQTFANQISWLKNNGYETIDFDNALKIFENKQTVTKKPVIITFDDGYSDAFTTAMPVLRDNDFTGVFYIISGFVKRPGFVSFDDISGLLENKMTIGCHTLSHLNLTTLDEAKLKSELSDCKESLSNVYSQPISDFCYPSGKYNPGVTEAVKAAGFKTAVTTESGIWKSTDSLLEIPRIRMTESTNLANFLK